MVVCGGDAAISQITLNTFKQHGECLHERNPKTLFFKLITILKIKFAPGSAFADHCTCASKNRIYSVNKLSRGETICPPDDRGGSASMRGRIRSPHSSGGLTYALRA